MRAVCDKRIPESQHASVVDAALNHRTIAYEGAVRERGYCSVDLQTSNGIFGGLPETITVWESHCDEVKDLPTDFIQTATNETSRIQAMQHTSRPLFGVQFHPELFDEEHPHGRTILENFLKL